MNKRELEAITVAELKKIAQKYRVRITSDMRKKDIVKSLDTAIKAGKKTVKKQTTAGAAKKVKDTGTTVKKAAVKKDALNRHTEKKAAVTTAAEKKTKDKKNTSGKKKTAKKTTPAASGKLKTAEQSRTVIAEEERIEGTKYMTGLNGDKTQFTYEDLPEEYNSNRLILMSRDPYWAYAYWEVSPDKIDEARLNLKDPAANLTLRIYDATESSSPDKALGLFDVEVFQRTGNWYIEIGRPGRSLYAELGMKSSSGEFEPIVTSNRVSTPFDRVSEMTDVEWTVTDEEFREIFAVSGGFGIGLSTARMIELMEQRFGQQVTSPGISSPGITSPGLFSPGLWSPGGWGHFGPVSPEEKGKQRRGFWFWVKTELIVYGATEPDATVLFQGQPVKLNPDGTFNMRFALPDGTQVMPVKAISYDRVEERSVTPVVTRETK